MQNFKYFVKINDFSKLIVDLKQHLIAIELKKNKVINDAKKMVILTEEEIRDLIEQDPSGDVLKLTVKKLIMLWDPEEDEDDVLINKSLNESQLLNLSQSTQAMQSSQVKAELKK